MSFEMKNKVILVGTLAYEFQKQSFGRDQLLTSRMVVPRTSKNVDVIRVTASYKIAKRLEGMVGIPVKVEGSLLIRPNKNDSYPKTVLLVNIHKVYLDEEGLEGLESNRVEIVGRIRRNEINGKNIHIRSTPNKITVGDYTIETISLMGDRQLKTVVPAIAWGSLAHKIKEFEPECNVSVIGRIQSREYGKKMEDGSELACIAYELSSTVAEEF